LEAAKFSPSPSFGESAEASAKADIRRLPNSYRTIEFPVLFYYIIDQFCRRFQFFEDLWCGYIPTSCAWKVLWKSSSLWVLL